MLLAYTRRVFDKGLEIETEVIFCMENL